MKLTSGKAKPKKKVEVRTHLFELRVLVRYASPLDGQYAKFLEIKRSLMEGELAEGAEIIGIKEEGGYPEGWIADPAYLVRPEVYQGDDDD